MTDETSTTDPDRAPTMAEQMRELNQTARTLRDEALLKPVAAAMESVGIETQDIDDASADVSLVRSAGAALAGPVLAGQGAVVGFYVGLRLTNAPDMAAVAALVTGLLLGAVGLVVGVRYLDGTR